MLSYSIGQVLVEYAVIQLHIERVVIHDPYLAGLIAYVFDGEAVIKVDGEQAVGEDEGERRREF